MTELLDDLFSRKWLPELDPPAGGLARLRQRIRRPALRWQWPVPVAVGATALVVLVLVFLPADRTPEPGKLEAELAAALAEVQRPPVYMEGYRTDELESAHPEVKMYLLTPEDNGG